MVHKAVTVVPHDMTTPHRAAQRACAITAIQSVLTVLLVKERSTPHCPSGQKLVLELDSVCNSCETVIAGDVTDLSEVCLCSVMDWSS